MNSNEMKNENIAVAEKIISYRITGSYTMIFVPALKVNTIFSIIESGRTQKIQDFGMKLLYYMSQRCCALRKGAAPDSQEHLNVLLGKSNTDREYIVQQNLNNTLAIVKGQWKYIEPSDSPAIEFWTKMELGNDKHPQLYDLSSDPSEKTNVAKQHPDIVKELSALLETVKE